MPKPVTPTEDRIIHQARRQAAQLLDDVLEERLTAHIAINRWPVYEPPQDISLEIAYQALWHFEADEDQQKSELFYLDTQLELLKQMAAYLGQGKALPGYMLKPYPRDRCVHFFYDVPLWKDVELQIRRAWQVMSRPWRQALSLLPQSLQKPVPIQTAKQKSLR